MLRPRKPIVTVVIVTVSLIVHTGAADSQPLKNIHVDSLQLKALNTYEISEEPYLLVFNWRVIPGKTGSASVTYRKVEPNFNEIFKRGETIKFERRDLSILNVQPWELAGTIVIAMEHDNTANATMNELMGRYVVDPLRVGLQSIESLTLPARVQDDNPSPFKYDDGLSIDDDVSADEYDTILEHLQRSLTEDILVDQIGHSLFRRRLNADDFVGYGATAWWNIPQENTDSKWIRKMNEFSKPSLGIVGGLLSSQSETEIVFASDWAESKYELNLSATAR